MRLFRNWIDALGVPGRLLAFLVFCIVWALALFFATLWLAEADAADLSSSSSRLAAVIRPLPGRIGGGEFGASGPWT